MPRYLLLLLSWIAVIAPLRADVGGNAELVTRDFLKEHGVAIHKTRNQTPMASQAIDLNLEGVSGLGQFDAVDCVVLAEPILREKLLEFEASPDETRIERRIHSTKSKITFLVRGSELGRAYLVFYFSADGASSAVKKREYIWTLDLAQNKR